MAGRLLMMTHGRVSQLMRDGWIARPLTVTGAVHGYLRFLRDTQRRAARVAVDGVVQRERARKFKLANDMLDGSLVEVGDAVAMIGEIQGLVTAELSAIPVRVTDDATLRRELADGIDKVVAGIARRSQQAVGDICAGRDVASGVDDAEPGETVIGLQCPLCP
jgi:hypothetical protein